MNNWKKTQLQEVVSKLGDGLHGTPKYSETGNYHFINGNNLSNGKIIFTNNTQKVSEEEYHKYKKNLNHRTILVSINGTLGNVAFYNDEKVILGKSACYFNVHENVDKRFIGYIVSSKIFKNYIESQATGTTIKNISLKQMREFSFSLPPLPTQRRIAAILSALDDKIENNRKICETLEQIAQSIFKRWFVDFEFDDAHGRPYKYSGGKMVESELGMIPEGWEIGDIGNYVKVKSGFAFKSQWWQEDGIPVVKIKSIQNQTINLNEVGFVSKDKIDLAKAFLVTGGDLLIAMTGATIGKMGIVPEIESPILVNQRVGKFFLGENPYEKISYLYCLLNQKNIYEKIVGRGDGSAQPNVSPTQIEGIITTQPPEVLIEKFNKTTKSNFKTWTKLLNENEILTQTRDTLLPKLMSGEVEV